MQYPPNNRPPFQQQPPRQWQQPYYPPAQYYPPPQPPPMQTMTRTYKHPSQFQRDQKHLARHGWMVVSSMQHQPQRSFAGKLFVPFGLFTLPKPSIIVTYQRPKYR